MSNNKATAVYLAEQSPGHNIMNSMTGYHEKTLELATELVNHGFGSMTIRVETLKDGNKTKVVVDCGKTYVYFIKRNISESFGKNII